MITRTAVDLVPRSRGLAPRPPRVALATTLVLVEAVAELALVLLILALRAGSLP